MNIRKSVGASFALVLLTIALTPLSSQQDARTYDPWIDANNDGRISGEDVAYVARLVGTEGTSINKTELLELLDRVESIGPEYEIALFWIVYRYVPPLTMDQAKEISKQGAEALVEMLNSTDT